MTDNTKLAVIVHENNEVTVRDARGLPHVCADCRYSGWLSKYEYDSWDDPQTCLLHSGGADPVDGDRIIKDWMTYDWQHQDLVKNDWRKLYPLCRKKNQDGSCEDFCPVKPLPWYRRWLPFFRPSRKQMRQ